MTIKNLMNELSDSYDVTSYFYEMYKEEEFFLQDPVKSWQVGEEEVFVFSNKLKSFEETPFYEYGEQGLADYNKLKNLSFYFVLLNKDKSLENIVIPNEIFIDLDEAEKFAKKLLLKI